MQSTLEFLLKITVCWTCSLVWYQLFLRRESHFMSNRVFLLVSFMAMPFLFFLPAYTVTEEVYTYNLAGIAIQGGVNFLLEPIARNWDFWLLLLLIGVGMGVLRLLINLGQLWWLTSRAVRQDFQGHRLLRIANSSDCYTFFGYIVIGDQIGEESLPCILTHEVAHRRFGHSFDLLLSELYSIVFWFHPMVYLYKFFLRELHEYQADSVVLKRFSLRNYGDLLLQRAMNTRVSLLHNFSHYSQLKNRLKMMSKKQKIKGQPWRYWMLMPVLLGILLSFNMQTVKAQVVTEPDEMPVFGVCNADDNAGLKQCSMNNLIAAIVKEFKYPKSASDAKKEGKVVVEFIVSENGEVKDAKVLKSLDTDCDAEALRVINALKGWSPGKKDGKNIGVKMVLPISFQLS